MVEPTEAETKDTLDRFVQVMRQIAREAEENPELIHDAPHDQPVGRLDETTAARKPVLRWSWQAAAQDSGRPDAARDRSYRRRVSRWQSRESRCSR